MNYPKSIYKSSEKVVTNNSTRVRSVYVGKYLIQIFADMFVTYGKIDRFEIELASVVILIVICFFTLPSDIFMSLMWFISQIVEV